MKRKLVIVLPSEWVVLLGKDGSVKKMRVKPRQRMVTWRETQHSGIRAFLRQTEKTDDGFPVYHEVDAAAAA